MSRRPRSPERRGYGSGKDDQDNGNSDNGWERQAYWRLKKQVEDGERELKNFRDAEALKDGFFDVQQEAAWRYPINLPKTGYLVPG